MKVLVKEEVQIVSIKLISVKCPECGANLPIEEGREQLFCSYCGTKVIITNDNEHVYRYVDDAQIKMAETKRIIQLKRIEAAERKRMAEEKTKKIKIIISIILGGVALVSMLLGGDNGLIVGMVALAILMYMWLYMWLFSLNGGDQESDEKDDNEQSIDDKIKVPFAAVDYEGKNYVVIETILKDAGFTNIRCIPLNDLSIGLLKKPGIVKEITINGAELTDVKRKFSSNTLIVISYHSYSNGEV